MSALDHETPLRQSDVEALHGLLLQLLLQSQSPSGRRERQAWLLLGECAQLLQNAQTNLSGEQQPVYDDSDAYS